MSIALVLTLCTATACNSYTIDSAPEWKRPVDCVPALVVESDYMARVWKNPKRLTAYVAQFDAIEPVAMLVDYDYTCEVVVTK